VRVFDFPRFQLFFIGAVAIAAQLAVGLSDPYWFHSALVCVATAVTLYQLARVVQFIDHPFKEMDEATGDRGLNEFTALVANVRYKNRDYKRLLRLVAEQSPDWVALIETDEHWQVA